MLTRSYFELSSAVNALPALVSSTAQWCQSVRTVWSSLSCSCICTQCSGLRAAHTLQIETAFLASVLWPGNWLMRWLCFVCHNLYSKSCCLFSVVCRQLQTMPMKGWSCISEALLIFNRYIVVIVEFWKQAFVVLCAKKYNQMWIPFPVLGY